MAHDVAGADRGAAEVGGAASFRHTIEERKGHLVVTLKLPLTEVLGQRQDAPEALERRLNTYLMHLGADVMEVTRILLEEGEVGRVKWFNESRGYGFIRTASSEDVFVHWRGISDQAGGFKTLKDGQKVRFRRRQGRETIEAIDVLPVDNDAD